MKRKVYLDYNATTPVAPEVMDAMLPFYKDTYGNASSMHLFGRESKKALEQARETVAKCLGAKHADEILFTGCGTESDNLAVKGVVWANKSKEKHIITSAIEHHAVLYTCQYLGEREADVSIAKVGSNGVISVETIEKEIRPSTILVSIMHANNEVGTIQPIEEIAALCRSKNIYFHTDAVQTAGKLDINVEKMNVDLLSISAHKFYGPKGVGALYMKRGTRITPLLHGGHHEKHKRAGTENIAGIVGMAKALELALSKRLEEQARLGRLRDMLESGILSKIEAVKSNGDPNKRLANTLSITFEYIEGEGIILSCDNEGIALSTGSACASGDLEPSHVLTALGIPKDKAHGTVRFSLGKYTTEEDIKYTLEVLPQVVERLRNMSPLWEDRVKALKIEN